MGQASVRLYPFRAGDVEERVIRRFAALLAAAQAMVSRLPLRQPLRR